MRCYRRVHQMLSGCLPSLAPTQTVNLALLVSAVLVKRCLCLTELARVLPTPAVRRVAAPKHDLLHRLKRLWRFTANPRIDPVAIQCTLIPAVIARLGCPRMLGLAIDWTMFDTQLPTGKVRSYQVLRIAVPRRDGRCRCWSWPGTAAGCPAAKTSSKRPRWAGCWPPCRAGSARSSWPTAASPAPPC